MDLIAEVRCDSAFSFVYSERPGTPAANLCDGVPPEVKKQRLSILQDRIQQLSIEYCRTLVGGTYPVLVERASKRGNGQMAGKLSNNRWVNFDGDESLVGDFVDVTVTEALSNSLRGRLAGAEATA